LRNFLNRISPIGGEFSGSGRHFAPACFHIITSFCARGTMLSSCGIIIRHYSVLVDLLAFLLCYSCCLMASSDAPAPNGITKLQAMRPILLRRRTQLGLRREAHMRIYLIVITADIINLYAIRRYRPPSAARGHNCRHAAGEYYINVNYDYAGQSVSGQLLCSYHFFVAMSHRERRVPSAGGGRRQAETRLARALQLGGRRSRVERFFL
jgi:hypothetical protein